MSDTMVSFPGLGFDPAPGSVGAVAQLAASMTSAQRQLTEALHIISSVGRGGTWTGDAASAFLSRVGELPRHLQQAEDSFSAAANELTGWQSQLASMKHKAQELESEAVNARARLQGAEMNPVLGLRGHVFSNGQELQQAQQQYDAAVQEINTAQQDLDVIIEQAKHLLAEHRGLAEDAAKAIDAAAHLAPDSPGLFASLLGDLEAVIEGNIKAAEDAWNWVKSHANAINAVGDMLATASSLLGLASMTVAAIATPEGGEVDPVVDAVIAGLNLGAAGLSAGALGAHGLAKAAGAPVTDRTLMEDGIGAVSFGFSKDAEKLTKGVKLSTSLTRAVALMGKGEGVSQALTVAGVGNAAVDLVGDPTSLGYFVPRNARQGVELLYGGPLLIGFENAWNAGSAKDRAAHGG